MAATSTPRNDDEDEDPVWTDLVEWLARFPGGTGVEEKVRLIHNQAGRGLVARGQQRPGTVLISIPNAALINLRTLRPLYPASFAALNAPQWISLHLALQFRRHLEDEGRPSFARKDSSSQTGGSAAASERRNGKTTTENKDAAPAPAVSAKKPTKRAAIPQDKFWPFLASLPRSFPTMPLTWSLSSRSTATLLADFSIPTLDASLAALKARESGAEGQKRMQRTRKRYAELLERMPSAVRRKADEVEKRFAADWAAVQSLWTEHGNAVGGELTFFDFVLGWQNVNTRCIYFDIDGKRENNLTLCPVIDMINHSPGRTTKPDPRLSSLTFCAPAANSPDPVLHDGDELSFQYGSHEDAFLLAEYGFVVGEENVYNAVEVDRFVEALFDAQGDEGVLKKGVLKDEGYWGDMTLQATPPPSPSWRVLVSLRLLHHRLAAGSTASLSASALAPWYHVVSGACETLSPSNETKVCATWRAMAENVAREAEEGTRRCDELLQQWEKEFKSAAKTEMNAVPAEEEERKDLVASLRMVRTVWTEEERIARAVLAVPAVAAK
ncbi:hypothetical protein JCM10908_004275 [Rhodotorula pacifica]|uniref:protein-lysine N-methyltransferase n=1 Tax=Rhodotorula pacifica TaxID=1495444 RepID=UPI003172FA61